MSRFVFTRIVGPTPDLSPYYSTMIAAYRGAYAARLNEPYSTPKHHWTRVEDYANRQGFEAVLARYQEVVVGYALGFTLAATARWWRGFQNRSEVDSSIFIETGSRTFALCEILVRKDWQRQGVGRRLHDVLMGERTENRATLIVRRNNEEAIAAYRSWGWHKLGQLKPYPDSEAFDSMVLFLPNSFSD